MKKTGVFSQQTMAATIPAPVTGAGRAAEPPAPGPEVGTDDAEDLLSRLS